MHSPGYIAETDEQAKAELWPHWKPMRNRIGAERGWGPTFHQRRFRGSAGPDGALYVGSPETVARKIADDAASSACLASTSSTRAGSWPTRPMMRSIELYATKVVPLVRDMLT